jgi:hypothetical protein
LHGSDLEAFAVIPAKTGIQAFQYDPDPGFRQGEETCRGIFVDSTVSPSFVGLRFHQNFRDVL